MAWTAPITAVASTAFNASDFNSSVRDNLLETLPGKATASGNFFVTSAANAMVQRSLDTATVTTSQSTTSTSYTDLSTAGPSVTLTTGTKAIIFFSAGMAQNTDNAAAFMAPEVSGASTVSAADSRAIQLDGVRANQTMALGCATLVTLNAGSNTFTLKYKAGSNTATFNNRKIAVWPVA